MERNEAVAESRLNHAESQRSANQTDQVSLSAAARELAEARKAVEAAPDVRQDRVAALQAQIDAGTYQVPVEALAAKLLGRVIGG